MRQIKQVTLGLIFCSSLVVSAQNNPVDITNYLRVEYDDNVFTTGDGAGTDPVDSFVLIESIEFLLDSQAGNTYWGIKYIPTFKYYEDRPDDDTDFSNQWDLSLKHDFTPRTSLGVYHTLRQAQEPELVADDVSFRNNNDYLYNSVDLDLITQIVPDKTSLQLSGRFEDMSYDDGDVADVSDYQELSGGVDLIQVLQPNTSLAAQFGYAELDYDSDFRDADSYQIGLALNKVFNPKLSGELRGGYQAHNPSDMVAEDTDSFYGDVNVRYEPLKGNRFTVGLGYGQEKSPVNIFSMQERFTLSGYYAVDLTAALTFNIGGSYQMGEFSNDNATSLFDPATDTAGDEETLFLSSSLNYEMNVRNSLVLSYTYSELDSDVRAESDYDRNRVSLGWQYRL